MQSAPLLTDEQAAIISEWARGNEHQLRAVLLYGSRYSGIRTPKENASHIPDVDLALSIRGANSDERLNLIKFNVADWEGELSRRLGGLSVHIASADADIGPVWAAGFLKDGGYKVLWKNPECWSPLLMEG